MKAIITMFFLLCASTSFAAGGAFQIYNNKLSFPDGSEFSSAPKDGKTIYNGSGAPAITATPGDFYLDTLNKRLYGPYAGSWGSGVSLVGPKGDNGLTPSTTAEPAGSNCAYGGVKIQVGANSPQYVCNAAATPGNYSGTYSGTEMVVIAQNSQMPTSSGTAALTLVVSQTGTAVIGTYTTDSGRSGTLNGVINGNIFSYSMSPSSPGAGCTSDTISGMGSIQGNVITFFGSGTTVCAVTYYSSITGTLTKQ